MVDTKIDLQSWEMTGSEVSMMVRLSLPRYGAPVTQNILIGESIGELKTEILDGKRAGLKGHKEKNARISWGIIFSFIFMVTALGYFWAFGQTLWDLTMIQLIDPIDIEDLCKKEHL